MRAFVMKLPVELDRRGDGYAVTGIDADGKRVHFQDLIGKGDRVPTGSCVDADGEPTGDTFGPHGIVLAWPTDRLRIVTPREVCDTFGHDVEQGRCPTCQALVGAVDLTELPHADYGAAARELAEIHAWLRKEHGLVQSEGDGEWGYVSTSIEATEWNETGSTLDAIRDAERHAHMEGYCRAQCELEGDGERVAALRGLLERGECTLERAAEIVGAPERERNRTAAS